MTRKSERNDRKVNKKKRKLKTDIIEYREVFATAREDRRRIPVAYSE